MVTPKESSQQEKTCWLLIFANMDSSSKNQSENVLFFSENVPVELRDPLYKDQYEQEHLKPAVSKLLLSPEIYCRAQALLAQAHGVSQPASQGSPADNSALLQFLIKKGFAPKVQDADVTEEDLSSSPIKTVCVVYLYDGIFSTLNSTCKWLNAFSISGSI